MRATLPKLLAGIRDDKTQQVDHLALRLPNGNALVWGFSSVTAIEYFFKAQGYSEKPAWHLLTLDDLSVWLNTCPDAFLVKDPVSDIDESYWAIPASKALELVQSHGAPAWEIEAEFTHYTRGELGLG